MVRKLPLFSVRKGKSEIPLEVVYNSRTDFHKIPCNLTFNRNFQIFFILDDSCVGRVSSKDWSNQRNFRIHSCLGEVNSSNHSSDKSLLVSLLAHFKERHQLPKLHSMHDYCIKQSDGY